MADKEIDVDALNDEDFAKLKDDLRSGNVVTQDDTTEPEPETEKPGQVRDEQGRFTKPEQAAEVADEPPDEEQDEEPPADAEPGKSKTVPHGQFHRERELRKQAQTERDMLAQNYQKLADRLQQLMETTPAPAAQEQQAAPVMPAEDDPLGRINWLVDTITKDREEQQKTRQLTQAQEEQRQFANGITALENEFRKTNPDYDQALQFVAKARDEELQLMYPMATQQERNQYILGEWNNIMHYAAAAGVNPVERVYQLAQARGYSKPAPQQQEQQQPAVPDLAKREETRKASLSLGKSGGAVTNTDRVSPEQLLEMTDAEFAAYKAQFGSVSRAFAA